MTRTVRDTAVLLDAIAGYDPNDPVTAYAAGRTPGSYADGLDGDGLRGARIGVIREPMDAKTDPESDDYRQVRRVVDRAIADLQRLGAVVLDPVEIPDLDQAQATYVRNNFETEEATDAYLAGLPEAPVRTLRDILLAGRVTPWRAKGLMSVVGRSTADSGLSAGSPRAGAYEAHDPLGDGGREPGCPGLMRPSITRRRSSPRTS